MPPIKVSLSELWKSTVQKQQQFNMWVDRAGDTSNLDYGHPYKLDVPRYQVSMYAGGSRRRGGGGSWEVEREAGQVKGRTIWRYLRLNNIRAMNTAKRL